MNSPRPALAFTIWLLLCLGLAHAGANSPPDPLSVSPNVVDFGSVLSNTECTQLVTLTFSGGEWSPDRLPTLRPTRSSHDVSVSLFARFVEPDTIRVVYRVVVDTHFHIGPFRYGLVLVDNANKSIFHLGNTEEEDIVVAGEIVQGLEAPRELDFGDIEVGQSETKTLDVGFYASSMAYGGQSAQEMRQDLFQHNASLAGTTVTSASPDVSVSNPVTIGLNASVWQTWAVTFKARLPLGKDRVELSFQTKDGYCATVLVVAEILSRRKPELHTRAKH